MPELRPFISVEADHADKNFTVKRAEHEAVSRFGAESSGKLRDGFATMLVNRFSKRAGFGFERLQTEMPKQFRVRRHQPADIRHSAAARCCAPELEQLRYVEHVGDHHPQFFGNIVVVEQAIDRQADDCPQRPLAGGCLNEV